MDVDVVRAEIRLGKFNYHLDAGGRSSQTVTKWLTTCTTARGEFLMSVADRVGGEDMDVEEDGDCLFDVVH